VINTITYLLSFTISKFRLITSQIFASEREVTPSPDGGFPWNDLCKILPGCQGIPR